MQPSHRREDARTREHIRGLDDPEYLALMRTWETADVPTNRAPAARHTLAAVLGALGVIAIATWGIRHLRATNMAGRVVRGRRI